MSRILCRKPHGRDLRVIIDIAPGETLLVVPASDVPRIKLEDAPTFFPPIQITNPEK